MAFCKQILSLFVCAGLLCGCRSSTFSAPASVPAPPASPSASLPEKGETQSPLQMLVYSTGLSSQMYAGTEEGCYTVRMNTDGSANIFYIDYRTRARLYLSASVNGNHQAPGDTSYIANALGGCVPAVDQDSLWIIKIGAPSRLEEEGEEALGAFYRYQLDGADPQLVARLENNQTFLLQSGLAYDDAAIYVLVREWNETENQTLLLRLDKATGALQELHRFGKGEFFQLLAVKDDLLLVSHLFFPEGGENLTPEQKNEQQRVELEAISRTTGEATSLIRWNQAEHRSTVAGGRFVTFEPATGAVTVRPITQQGGKPALGQEETIAAFAPLGQEFDQGRVEPASFGFGDRVLLVRVDSKEEKTEVRAIRLEDGKDQVLKTGETAYWPQIVAETKDKFLVETGYFPREIDLVGTDGIPYKAQTMEAELTLINKEAYWAGSLEGERIDEAAS